MNKVIIFSAPSGAGKSTILNHMMGIEELKLRFSVSATTRPPRGNEINGKEYYFLSLDDFKQRLNNDEFLEHEEVYPDCFYGTLKSEVERLFSEGYNVAFDIDVVGGVNLKRQFGDQALALFIQPPSIEVLLQRLVNRQTDSAEMIEKRVAKAEWEMTFQPQFDATIVNDQIEQAREEAYNVISKFLCE